MLQIAHWCQHDARALEQGEARVQGVAPVPAQSLLAVSVRDWKHGNTSCCGKCSDHLLLVLTLPHICIVVRGGGL